jgi:catechol 2,3-dioxygenase-like lactoylglutathione lyase family enzyme
VFKQRFILLVTTACFPALLVAEKAVQRPAITGVSHMTIYAADLEASKKFYRSEIGLAEGHPDAEGNARYFASSRQYIVVAPLPANHDISRMESVAFVTTDAEGMRRYLAGHAIQVPAHVSPQADGRISFEVKDPEGHTVGFEQDGPATRPTSASVDSPFTRIIHVGFLVHDCAAEDSFYKQLLGFRPYWHGGRNGADEWISLQVPDGSDWVEYMLAGSANPTQKLLGVLNHFSLGVGDIHAAAHVLEGHGWRESADEQPKLGRDGKWQLNIYDPDLTRVEFMEFKPARPPCCSEFTAAHPQP